MVQKIKGYLQAHEKQYELLRYLIAGGLTTLLSMVIHYGCCFIMAADLFPGWWIPSTGPTMSRCPLPAPSPG